MTRFQAGLRGAFILGFAWWVFQAWLPGSAQAQEDDPGLIRTLQTDSASIENDYYFQVSLNNDTSPYHGIYSYGEGLFALGKDLGLEADFPALFTWYPLGQEDLVLGPIGLYLRYEFYHFGTWNSETAGAFSIQAGGAYGFSNSDFPSVGSSWSFKALGGYRAGKFFLQGTYGYQGGIDPRVPSQWRADTGLGFRLGSDWYLQAEADLTAVTAPASRSSWAFIPQIAFQPDDWLLELGESFNEDPSGTTEFLIARAF